MTRLEVSQALRELMSLTCLTSTLQLAALLRNPGDSYPSDGLVRTYLLKRQDASERFVELLRVRRAEVESQLAEGVAALEIAGRVRRFYYVEPKRHVITILDHQALAQAEFRHPDELAALVSASLVIPKDWLRLCAICGKPFVARSSRSEVCYRRNADGKLVCKLEAHRRRRRASRDAAKALLV